MITICGQGKTRDELRQIPLPLRPDNPRWVGIQHGEIADTLERILYGRGIRVKKEMWATSQDDQTLVGGLNIEFPSYLDIPALEGMDYSIGLRHSNDCKHAMSFMVGAQIFICTNGIATGELVLNRKHTSGVNLREVLYDGLTRYIQKAKELSSTIWNMKARGLSRSDADNLLMQAGRARLLPWSGIGKVDKEYRDPTFADHDRKSAWGLYNAFTYVAQNISPVRQLGAINGFRKIVNAEVN